MQVICLQDEAFYALIEQVLQRLNRKQDDGNEKWISGEEVMQRLGIKSKTTLQKLRDSGSIRFSQPEKKIIRYDSSSIDTYLEKHVRECF